MIICLFVYVFIYDLFIYLFIYLLCLELGRLAAARRGGCVTERPPRPLFKKEQLLRIVDGGHNDHTSVQ